MSDINRKVLDTLEKVIPKLNDTGKEKLLSFGEGMLFVANTKEKEDKAAG